ncbi:MAG TPA: hypothetical protein VFL91_22475 [Thermomicrobiales bacterium]|nr:hypothetical protein [Thermomicrobiales bacterium]
MAAWRRKALEAFPALRRDLNQRDYSIYELFMDLLPLVQDAHDADDADTLRRIYGFAEWCLSQRSGDLGNAAGVSFYEHLFDRKDRHDWAKVIPWLSPYVIRDVWGLWEWMLTPEELHDLRKMLGMPSSS